MANCYICDKITDIRIDPRDGKSRPCPECEAIIADAVGELELRDTEFFDPDPPGMTDHEFFNDKEFWEG